MAQLRGRYKYIVLKRGMRTMIVIGTSAVVQPAASLPLIARRNGARLIEISPDETPLSDAADEMLRGPARLLTRLPAQRQAGGQAAIELPAW